MFHVKQFTQNLVKLPIHELLFYIFVFFIPIQTRILFNAEAAYIHDYFNYSQAFFVYLSDLILLLSFTSWALFSEQNKIFKTIFWISFISIIWIGMGLFHMKQLDFGLYQGLKWIEFLAVIYFLSQSSKYIQIRVIVGIIYISGIIQALIGLVQFHVQHTLGLKFLGEYIAPIGTPGLATFDTIGGKIIRAYGTMPHPNILGAFLLFALIIGFYLVSHATKKHQMILWIGNFILILAAFTTFSRLAWIGALISILIFGVRWFHGKQYPMFKNMIILAIVSCATITTFYLPYLQSRVAETSTQSVSYIDRAFFNQMGFETVKSYPIWGTGIGNYVVEQQKLWPDLKSWQYQPPHNIFIFITAEQGIIGLLIYITLLGYIFLQVWKVPQSEVKHMLLLVAAIFLLLGQFDHYFATIQQGRLMWAMVLGLLAALSNYQDEITNTQQ